MKLDEKKIAFICCTNDPLYYAESMRYIKRLQVPKGFTLEFFPVYNARSMCAGYNDAMKRSDAMYKIYLHQDVFILNPYFLENIITLFELYPDAAMIGMVGSARLPDSGIMWRGPRNLHIYWPTEAPYVCEKTNKSDQVIPVECIDGFMMVTRVDVPWREDLFDGWDFYDISQSFEFHRKGYRIIVPVQQSPWCLHDDGAVMLLLSYEKHRRCFLKEYGEEIETFAEEHRGENCFPKDVSQSDEEKYIAYLNSFQDNAGRIQEIRTRMLEDADRAIKLHDASILLEEKETRYGPLMEMTVSNSAELLQLWRMMEAAQVEKDSGWNSFIDDVDDYDAFREKFVRSVFSLRRLEFDVAEEDCQEGFKFIRDRAVSALSIAAILYDGINFLGHWEMVMLKIAEDALAQEEAVRAYQFLSAIMKPTAEALALRNELGQALQFQ